MSRVDAIVAALTGRGAACDRFRSFLRDCLLARADEVIE
jgi:hypothetical protein